MEIPSLSRVKKIQSQLGRIEQIRKSQNAYFYTLKVIFEEISAINQVYEYY